MQLFSGDATMFFKKNLKLFFDLENIKKPPQKIAYFSQLGVFFLCSPDFPKQPRTSFPFYKFFYPIESAKVSVCNSPKVHKYSTEKKRKRKNLGIGLRIFFWNTYVCELWMVCIAQDFSRLDENSWPWYFWLFWPKE